MKSSLTLFFILAVLGIEPRVWVCYTNTLTLNCILQCCLFFFIFETWSHYVAQAGPQLRIVSAPHWYPFLKNVFHQLLDLKSLKRSHRHFKMLGIWSFFKCKKVTLPTKGWRKIPAKHTAPYSPFEKWRLHCRNKISIRELVLRNDYP